MVLRVESTITSDRSGALTFHEGGDGDAVIDAADSRLALPSRDRNRPEAIAAQMTLDANKRTKRYQPIGDLPLDDPDLTIDPDNYPTIFWADADRNPVARTGQPVALLASGPRVQITIFWDGDTYVPEQEAVP